MMLNNMFLVENNVPDVYINESRDFQLIAKLYDLALQSTRFSIDSMEYISDTNRCINTILPLIGTKVGFFTSQKLTDKVLRKVLSAFPFIIRHKGSKTGIQLVLNLFERITNTKVAMEETDDPNILIIRFFNYMLDVDLLRELLECIRPTGMLFQIEFKTDVSSVSDYSLTDKVTLRHYMQHTDLTPGELSGVVMKTDSDDTLDNDISSNIGFTITAKTDEDKEIEAT